MDEGILVLLSFWDGVDGAMSQKQATSEQVEGLSPSGLPLSTLHATPGPMELTEEKPQWAQKVQPREMTPEEEATWGPEMALRNLSAFNRSSFDPALLAPYIGQWIAWSPDSSRVVAHAEDVKTLDELVTQAGEDPSRCPLEYLDGE